MEEDNRDLALDTDFGEFNLDPAQLVIRRQEPAVLIGIRITDHDFLYAALFPDTAPDHRRFQQGLHDPGGNTQVFNGLKQRYYR